MDSAQPERRWQVWVRVRLGGERRIDAARACGYKDGSAVTQILSRLQIDAQKNPKIPIQMARLENDFNRISSCFKS